MSNQRNSGAADAMVQGRAPGGLLAGVGPHVRMGVLATLSALVILLLVSAFDSEMGIFWTFGLAFGFDWLRKRKRNGNGKEVVWFVVVTAKEIG